jgi:hypothetical protein
MTSATSTLSRPGIIRRTRGVGFALTFVVGVAVGLAVPQLSRSSVTGGGSSTISPSTAIEAWRVYRAGERALDAEVFTTDQVERAWLDFRAGERAVDGGR